MWTKCERTCHVVTLLDDVIKWKHFPRYWPFVRGIHRSPVNSPHKGQWRGALMFSLICAWTNGLVNNPAAGDLRRHRVHYEVTVMLLGLMLSWHHPTFVIITHFNVGYPYMYYTGNRYSIPAALLNNSVTVKRFYIGRQCGTPLGILFCAFTYIQVSRMGDDFTHGTSASISLSLVCRPLLGCESNLPFLCSALYARHWRHIVGSCTACLQNNLFGLTTKKGQIFASLALCEGNSQLTSASNAESLSMSWRHHDGVC